MGYHIVRFDDTPNPNAIKCALDRNIVSPGQPSRSFRSAAEAHADPLATALFEIPGVTSVLFCADWVTVCKAPDAQWRPIKAGVKKALARG